MAKQTLTELAEHIVEAKEQIDVWDGDLKRYNTMVLNAMEDGKMTTTTVETPTYGQVLITVVAPESAPVIDHEKTRANLQRNYGDAVMRKVYHRVTMWQCDEEALEALVGAGVVSAKTIARTPGAKRNKYVRTTVKKSSK